MDPLKECEFCSIVYKIRGVFKALFKVVLSDLTASFLLGCLIRLMKVFRG